MPQPVYVTMRDRTPAARLVTVDAGHNVYRAAPEEFLRALRQHLSHPPDDPESFVGPTASTR